MTEREIEARLRNERISLPDGFEARQEAALRRVMAKREGVLPKRMAWLAAALVLMMSAVAIAAGGRGLAFFWRQASPEAELLIEKKGLRNPAASSTQRNLSFGRPYTTAAFCKRSLRFRERKTDAP